MKTKLTIGVDFDGTVVTHKFPQIGEDIGAVPILKRIIECGHRLILFTMRSDVENPTSDDKDIHPIGGQYLSDAINWFNENDIPLFAVNENPEQRSWTHSPKPYCNLYIDDATLGCPLIYPEGDRPYVDWNAVEKILKERGILW